MKKIDKEEKKKDYGTDDYVFKDFKIEKDDLITNKNLLCKEFFECTDKCPQGNEGDDCREKCMENTKEEEVNKVLSLIECVSTNKCDKEENKEKEDECIVKNCAEALSICFGGGNKYKDCYELYGCIISCSPDLPDTEGVDENSACSEECIMNASATAMKDFYELLNCTKKDCKNLPIDPESLKCYLNSVKGNCKEKAKKCIPSKGKSCLEILVCVQGCGSDKVCGQKCGVGASLNASILFYELMICIEKECPAFETICLIEAISTNCKNAYNNCIADK